MRYSQTTWRPVIPATFYTMTRDEIVELLVAGGYSRKMAERDADAFDVYRGGTKISEQTENDVRNDSVSEMSSWERAINTFRRR